MFRGKIAALVFILICKTDSLRLTISLNICFVKLQSSALHISGMVAEGCRARPCSCGIIYAPIFRTILDSRSPTFEKYIVRSIVFGATYSLSTFSYGAPEILVYKLFVCKQNVARIKLNPVVMFI